MRTDRSAPRLRSGGFPIGLHQPVMQCSRCDETEKRQTMTIMNNGDVMFARPDALLMQCRTPFGAILVSWEQDEDSGEWKSMVTALRFDEVTEEHEVMDRFPAGEMFITEDGQTPDAACVREAAGKMLSLALHLQADYDQTFAS